MSRIVTSLSSYPQAVNLGPSKGVHYLLCNRSAAHMQLGHKQEALADALQAMQHAPPTHLNVREA